MSARGTKRTCDRKAVTISEVDDARRNRRVECEQGLHDDRLNPTFGEFLECLFEVLRTWDKLDTQLNALALCCIRSVPDKTVRRSIASRAQKPQPSEARQKLGEEFDALRKPSRAS